MLPPLPILVLLVVAPARARNKSDTAPATEAVDTAVVEAEHLRLSHEMKELAARRVWKGAEAQFERIEALKVQPTFDDLVISATAARMLGDVQIAYDRLRRAARMRPDKHVVDELWNIDQHYGRVKLVGAGPLRPASLPLDPVQRAAIERAESEIDEHSIFSGVLPVGTYTFGERTFKVEAGQQVAVELRSGKHHK